MKAEIWQAFWETLIMVGISTVASVMFGTVLGVALFLTSKNQLADNKPLYAGLGNFTNIMRAFPFVILMIVIIPVTRLIV
ncbi:metal ABC transporter permease, partial [Mycobacterium tuberculosis]|nr:metal ABC transporter permease [Mycobacterium tuberculosis]